MTPILVTNVDDFASVTVEKEGDQEVIKVRA